MRNQYANRFKQSLVFLVRGRDQGFPAWYYVLVKDQVRLELLQRRCNGEAHAIPLNDYGTVIESGWGENPPEEIQKKIEALYG